MTEVLNLIMQLSQDFEVIKAYILDLQKSKLQLLQEGWTDGKTVMQSMQISKRTLQSLRDCGVLPYSRINGKFYYKVEDIEKLLESNYSHPKPTSDATK